MKVIKRISIILLLTLLINTTGISLGYSSKSFAKDSLNDYELNIKEFSQMDALNLTKHDVESFAQLKDVFIDEVENSGISIEEMNNTAIKSLDYEIMMTTNVADKEVFEQLKNTVLMIDVNEEMINSNREQVENELQKLPDTTLITEDSLRENNISTTSASMILGYTYATCHNAVRLAISYFSSQKMWLSAELLQTAYDNDSTQLVKYPRNIDKIRGTLALNAILKNAKLKTGGQEVFRSQRNTIEKDAYYSIHRFTYYRYNRNGLRCIDLHDVYDFSLDLSYAGLPITAAAVNIMVAAQAFRIIVPYTVKHTFKY